MTFPELQDATKMAEASDKKRAPLRMRKGQFGMGLKSASKSLGRTLEIHTRSIKSPGITIGLEHLDNKTLSDSWKAPAGYETDEKEPDCPLGSQEHGTAIIISNLKRQFDEDDILNAQLELGEIFHYAIELLNSSITINGDAVLSQLPTMNPDAPLLKLDDFNLYVREDLGGGRRGEPIQIRGWAGIMLKTMSGDLRYGFQTFRKDQLIEMNHNKGYRANPPGLWPYTMPHAELARLYGHIHLDMIPPNFHKKGWNNDSPAWTEVVDALKDVLEPLVIFARRTDKDVKKDKEMLGAFTRYANTREWKVPRRPRRKPQAKKPGDKSEEKPPEAKTSFSIDGVDYEFLTPIQETDHSETKPPWEYVVDHSSHEIQITVYMGHPIWGFARRGGNKIITKISHIDVFCQIMQDKGYSVAQIQARRETLYRETFGGGKNANKK